MAKPVRLRTEIIVNVIILLGGALLFSGFLLLKLTERELVAQQVKAFSATAEIIASVVAADPHDIEQAEKWLTSNFVPLEAWVLVDEQLTPLGQLSHRSGFKMARTELLTVRQTYENKIRLNYDNSSWFGKNDNAYVLISLPLLQEGQFVGAVQLRFSLTEMVGRMRDAQRWFVGYILVYGTLLSFFGFYLLNRNVVRPIRRLRIATEQISAGDLDLTSHVTGPREIAELSESFTSMVSALKESRAETGEYIDSLEAANEDLRTAHRRLARSEKLATIGHLAAGMAHEIGNPLGAVSGYLQLLRTESDPVRLQELVDRASAETARIDRLVRDLLDYARPSSDVPGDVVVEEIVNSVVEMLRHQGVFDRRQFTCAVAEGMPAVRIDPHRLQQVLVNLLLNARDATAENHEIRLETVHWKEWVQITVRDSGSGMSADVVEHIFDPFYTTKDPDKGRGLGLAVCHRIVEDAGGRIDVESVVSKGATFIVRLPSVVDDIEIGSTSDHG